MWILKLRRLAKKAGREALILWFAVRDPRTPLPLKLAAGAALGYFVSPVDLLPDLLLIGWIDDLLLLSLGVPFLIRSLPREVLDDAAARADRVLTDLGLRPVGDPDGAGGEARSPSGFAEASPGGKPRARRPKQDESAPTR
ncbi:MAG: hypothetical protein RIS35_3630, partial [Pseudomonadota bacterium]